MEKNVTLEWLNSDEVERLIPLIVYLVLICVTGIYGNLIVLYVYKTKYRPSNCRLFVICLSGIDIFICVCVVPVELITVFRQYNFTAVTVCRCSVFLSTWSTLATGFFLLAIAVDRYRKVCHAFHWQLSLHSAKLICGACLLIALLFSWLSPVIYGIHTAQDQTYNITLTVCTISDDMAETIYPLINNITFAVLFLGTLVSMMGMYCFIGVRVTRHEKKRKLLNKTRSVHHAAVADASNASELTIRSGFVAVDDRGRKCDSGECNTDSDALFCSQTSDGKLQQELEAEPSISAEHHIRNVVRSPSSRGRNTRSVLGLSVLFGRTLSVASNFKARISHTSSTLSGNTVHAPRRINNSRQLKSHRTAYIMFIISVAFVISYLPLLCILLMRSTSSDFITSLSESERAAYKFFLRSYYLNCAINPVIYGLSDARFRKASKKLLKSKLKCCS